MAGHQEVAGRAATAAPGEVAAADLAGWGGFATVVAGLLALAAGSGWVAALLVCCLGGVATATLCWASALRAHAERQQAAGAATASTGTAAAVGGPVTGTGPAASPGSVAGVAGVADLPASRRSAESGDAAHRPG